LQRLRELGWIEGSNITMEYRWVELRGPGAPILTFPGLALALAMNSGTVLVGNWEFLAALG
jgi:hypothetical protein